MSVYTNAPPAVVLPHWTFPPPAPSEAQLAVTVVLPRWWSPEVDNTCFSIIAADLALRCPREYQQAGGRCEAAQSASQVNAVMPARKPARPNVPEAGASHQQSARAMP